MSEALKIATDTMIGIDYAYREDFEDDVRTAAVWAAIAQAEALARIAEALEAMATNDTETIRPALRVMASVIKGE